MHKFSINLEGEKVFTQEELSSLIESNILDAVVCIRSVEGTVILNSPVNVILNKVNDVADNVTHLLQSVI